MKKQTLFALVILVLAIVVCSNAYAGFCDANCPVRGFFQSVGGFLYNALPWNWGNWFGK